MRVRQACRVIERERRGSDVDVNVFLKFRVDELLHLSNIFRAIRLEEGDTGDHAYDRE